MTCGKHLPHVFVAAGELLITVAPVVLSPRDREGVLSVGAETTRWLKANRRHADTVETVNFIMKLQTFLNQVLV